MTLAATPKFGFGASVLRVEDQRFITGAGQYVDDIQSADALVGFVVRSPLAHATFKINNKQDVAGMPGVALVMTADDISNFNPMPTMAMVPQSDGKPPYIPLRHVLAQDTVRHVGEAVAFVVADTLAQAKDAAEALDIDWDDLPVVMGTKAATLDGAPNLWPDAPGNKAFHQAAGDKDKMAEAFAKADRVSSIEINNNRLVCNYMEPRACLADYDGESERYTISLGSQGGHSMRNIIAAEIMKIDEDRLRVVTPDVGGGFGTKLFVYREYPLCLAAAERTGKPVKWTCERTEHFLADAHGRDNISIAKMAVDADGHFLGLHVEVFANVGAYVHQFGPLIPFLGLSMTSGLYDIDAVYAEAHGVLTNTVPVDAYRGAGRPEAAYLIERLVDQVAHDTGLSVDEIRRRNLIAPENLPYATGTGREYDSGEFAAHMDEAMSVADWGSFQGRADASAAHGKFRGIGMATYIEACSFPGEEPGYAELNEDGTVTILIGTQSNGQGHATAYAQIVGEHLGLDVDKINLIQGDTDRVKTGGGTGGSRSVPLGGPSFDIAGRTLARQLKEIAADQLEAAQGDIELAEGVARIAGTDRSISFAEIYEKASDPALLKSEGKFEQKAPTYPNGTHICEVEVDPETGEISVERFTIVDDFGKVVNPLLLAGQVHGGVVQSIGQAFHEQTVYDEDGQLLSASLMDYCMPRADDVPSIDFNTRNIPTTVNALGIKGAGEAGSIGATPAVMNALGDALRRGCGKDVDIQMPATPSRVWDVIQQARTSH